MDTETVLLILLSSTLIIFLIVGIIALLKINQILDSIKRLAAKAEHVAENAEVVSEFFKNATGPLAIGKVIKNITDHLSRKSKER